MTQLVVVEASGSGGETANWKEADHFQVTLTWWWLGERNHRGSGRETTDWQGS